MAVAIGPRRSKKLARSRRSSRQRKSGTAEVDRATREARLRPPENRWTVVCRAHIDKAVRSILDHAAGLPQSPESQRPSKPQYPVRSTVEGDPLIDLEVSIDVEHRTQ